MSSRQTNGQANGKEDIALDTTPDRSELPAPELKGLERKDTRRKVHLALTRLPSGSTSEVVVKRSKNLTRNEKLTMASICCGNFCLGTLYAMLAPFFPYEAEQKDVSPTQYGFIFGIFEFGQFLFAPVVGILIPWLTTKVTLTTGLLISGCCTTAFAGLQWTPGGWTYFWVAFLLRLVNAAGAAAFFTASFTLVATNFQDKISTLFALTEMFFGFGMIAGPSLGGVMYEYGGFACPFFVMGVATLVASLFASICLPKPHEKKVSPLSLIMKPGVMINMLVTFTSFVSVGFNDATLEHHLREFTSLTPTAVGGMFLVSGVTYALTTQVWGMAIDKFGHAHMFVIFGYVCATICFLLCGPMYPIPLKPTLALVIVAQLMYGISTGPQLVGSFTEGLSETVRAGFPDDVSTSASMSSIYQSACALGAAVGPSMGGSLLDSWGYEKASCILVLIQIVMILALVSFNVWRKVRDDCGTRNLP